MIPRVLSAPAYAGALYVRDYSDRDRRTVRTYTRNVAALLDHATPGQWRDGTAWYDTAADALLTAVPDVPLERLATACAAVSPGMPWGSTIETVSRLARMDAHTPLERAVAGLAVPYGYRNHRAALSALQGSDVLRGAKVRAFRDGIVTRGATVAVCVDGHAALLARNGLLSRRPGITSAGPVGVRDYRKIAAAHAIAAHDHDLWPAQAQAIAWLVWRGIPT